MEDFPVINFPTDYMTYEQAERILAELWNFKMEFIARMNSDTEALQQMSETLEKLLGVNMVLTVLLGMALGALIAIAFIKGWNG